MNNQELLNLEDITLIPSVLNNGWRNENQINYLTRDFTGSIHDSLPIFTSPMPAITNEKNWRIWESNKINSVIPRTVDIGIRSELCQQTFTCLSFDEIKQLFLDQDRRCIQSQFKICLDVGNGHDSLILDVASKLKSLYGKQIILMGGNIENPDAYTNYSKAGFDFIRLGMTSGSLVQKDKFGFGYPMASLILDTCKVRDKSKNSGIRPINIIADGGISSYSDIMKSIALGADYVMIGKEFAKILEAAGTVYSKKRTMEGVETVEEILKSTDLGEKELKDLDVYRLYSGNTTIENQLIRSGYSSFEQLRNPKIIDSKNIWVSVNKRLDTWVGDLKETVKYCFMMTNSKTWREFRNNVRLGRL